MLPASHGGYIWADRPDLYSGLGVIRESSPPHTDHHGPETEMEDLPIPPFPEPAAPGLYHPRMAPTPPTPHAYFPPRSSTHSSRHHSSSVPALPSRAVAPGPAGVPPYIQSGPEDYFSQRLPFPEPIIGPKLRHAYSAPLPPPLPHKPSFRSPPVPSKPPNARQPSFVPPLPPYCARNGVNHLNASRRSPRPDLPPKPADEDEELRRALELSLQESKAQQLKARAEHEQLSRALQESLAIAGDEVRNPPVSDLRHRHSTLDLHNRHRSQVLDATPAARGHSAAKASPAVPPPVHPYIASAKVPDLPFASKISPADSEVVFPHRGNHSSQRSATVSAPPTTSAPTSNANASQSAPDATLRAPTSFERSISAGPAFPSQDNGSTHAHRSPRCPPEELEDQRQHPQRHIETPSGPAADGDQPIALPAEASEAGSPRIPEELLQGVAMGFGAAPISASREPMKGTVPNLISLPYKKHKPFYIRGLNWRTLLKLMARMSAARVEPSIEAIAKVKSEMRLRVVVSFVKVHSKSPDWNTILYMTIDRPVPVTQAAWKYRSGDANTLPWSYTLSSPLPMLRDGADTPLSRYYTIPNTPGNLYPILPIGFPDLAAYLATALDVSRNGAYDTAFYPGLRRLGKIVDSLYPEDSSGMNDEDKPGMRQKMKNLVGLGKSSRDRNAETYDLVTPFVPDDYGR
ncbi:uncharacterized protein FIBRA_01452 [Fibroporia radiculosa]|uniref:Uncharacterized protein n=1 Tax=Fibroporia radiculosa TaxID=599839 RepID=J4H146_9APHY|nr:uncharacterized protein FIBRA_01452 [Fibroporia radiculosa]CCL99434.1 predicted protein [Fibroporia radiculosa]